MDGGLGYGDFVASWIVGEIPLQSSNWRMRGLGLGERQVSLERRRLKK